MKIPCNIVQDLLPSYIDEICSEETKRQMKEHMQECPTCEEKCMELKDTFARNMKQNQMEESLKEIEPMKKIRRRHWEHMLILSVAVLILLFGSTMLLVQKYRMSDNTLEMKIRTDDYGEVFAKVEKKLKRYWNVGEELQFVTMKQRELHSEKSMDFLLEDEKYQYQLTSSYDYNQKGPLKVEIIRTEKRQQGISKKFIAFRDFVDCVKLLDYKVSDNNTVYALVFQWPGEEKTSLIYDSTTYLQEGYKMYVYEDGVLSECGAGKEYAAKDYYQLEFFESTWEWEEEDELRQKVNEKRGNKKFIVLPRR